ncbi:hypothetical protein TCAL_00776, partial [Tigriopus californicus]
WSRRHKLLAEQNLSLAKSVQLCQAEEAATLSSSNMGGKIINKISSYRKLQRPSKLKYRTNATQLKSKCHSCGYADHKTNSAGPAAEKTCNKCNRKGHFQSMCQKKKNKNVRDPSRTGKIVLKCRPAMSKSFEKVAWIPDTGSDVDGIDPVNFNKMSGSVDMLNPDQEAVRDVTGTPLESLGCCPVVFLHGNEEITSVVHVFEHSFSPEWQKAVKQVDLKEYRSREKFRVRSNRSTIALKALVIGTGVDIQDPRSKTWMNTRVCIGQRRDYYMKTLSGAVY